VANKDTVIQKNRIFLLILLKRFKPGVEQYLIIADLTDANKDNISFSQCMTGVKNLMSFFPQYSYKMYIINGGFMVKMLYNAIKPILKERHKKKVIVFLALVFIAFSWSSVIVMIMKHIIF